MYPKFYIISNPSRILPYVRVNIPGYNQQPKIIYHVYKSKNNYYRITIDPFTRKGIKYEYVNIVNKKEERVVSKPLNTSISEITKIKNGFVLVRHGLGFYKLKNAIGYVELISSSTSNALVITFENQELSDEEYNTLNKMGTGILNTLTEYFYK